MDGGHACGRWLGSDARESIQDRLVLGFLAHLVGAIDVSQNSFPIHHE